MSGSVQLMTIGGSADGKLTRIPELGSPYVAVVIMRGGNFWTENYRRQEVIAADVMHEFLVHEDMPEADAREAIRNRLSKSPP